MSRATPRTPQIGDVYRDQWDDKTKKNQRTIRVVEVYTNGVRAKVLTDIYGLGPDRPRETTLMFTTLRTYELIFAGTANTRGDAT